METPHWRTRLRNWLAGTLAGHVVLVEACFAIPVFLAISAVNGALGILTPAGALRAASFWMLLGALAAGLIWFTITAPQLRRERPRRSGKA
jgi:hypothetical protein